MKLRIVGVLLLAGGVAGAQQSEYGGPAILSRGQGPGFARGGDLVKMRLYASVNGIYDTGLTALSVDSLGGLANDSDYGVQAGLGAYGYHRWKKTLLGLDYRGSFQHYATHSYYDGSDQALNLGLTHQMSKRTSFTLRQVAGTASRLYGFSAPYGFTDPNFGGAPTNELFDNRTTYLQSMGDLTFQKSARLSFNFGGSGSTIRRRSQALAGYTGAVARGDIMYRLSRRQTIGVDYSFTHYKYSQAYGTSDTHTAALNYSVQLARRWVLSLRAGGARLETQGLVQIAIDPAIAAIIGRRSGVEIFHGLHYVPSTGASLNVTFRRSYVALTYGSGVSPGNGLYLTSRSNTAGAYYSYTGLKRWNVGGNFDWSSYSSLSRELSPYNSFGGGFGASCLLGHGLYFTSKLDVRRYEVQGLRFSRTANRGTIGLSFSSGDLPLSLW